MVADFVALNDENDSANPEAGPNHGDGASET